MKNMKRILLLLLFVVIIILGGCGISDPSNDSDNTDEVSFIEEVTDYTILENGCVIVVTTSRSFSSMKLAVACPIIIQQGN